MTKALLLRLHRWAALSFALPLLAIIITGLILSFEPIVIRSAIQPGSVTAQSMEALLRRHDPQGTARVLFVRPREQQMSLGGGSAGGAGVIDLRTGEPARKDGMTLSDVFGAARGVHERLIFGAGWLVIASTIVMLVLAALGILMGWPRLRNTLSGWHKALGWLPLPLVILSPLTGLLLAMGITFAPADPGTASGPPMPLPEAVRVLGSGRDLSGLSWIRPLGSRLVARIHEDGEMRTYTLTRDGAIPDARNWPRLIHEGTWGGVYLPILTSSPPALWRDSSGRAS